MMNVPTGKPVPKIRPEMLPTTYRKIEPTEPASPMARYGVRKRTT
jgi:hypothetical protein